MPAGLEVTVPLPDPELATVNNGLSVKVEVTVPVPAPVRETDSKRWVELLNWATTAVYFWIETMQGFVCPAHAPDQPIKVSPLAGVAVRLTTVPFGYNSMQSLPQSMPGMVELIVPAPRTSAVK